MGNIYGSAQEVMIWLGKGDRDTKDALRSVDGIVPKLAEIL
jgi:hypothetical protein